MEDTKLPFLLGRVLDEQVRTDDDKVLVEWLLPESTRTGGRSRARLDIFCAWRPVGDRPLGDGAIELPDIVIPAQSVLIGNVELEEHDFIPFSCFDRLRQDHDIHVSGFALSRTARGNVYRAHLLMSGV